MTTDSKILSLSKSSSLQVRQDCWIQIKAYFSRSEFCWCVTYSCRDSSQSMMVKGVPGQLYKPPCRLYRTELSSKRKESTICVISVLSNNTRYKQLFFPQQSSAHRALMTQDVWDTRDFKKPTREHGNFTARSREVSKPRDWSLDFSNRSKISQALRQQDDLYGTYDNIS